MITCNQSAKGLPEAQSLSFYFIIMRERISNMNYEQVFNIVKQIDDFVWGPAMLDRKSVV